MLHHLDGVIVAVPDCDAALGGSSVLQAGPLASEQQASQLCSKLKAQGISLSDLGSSIDTVARENHDLEIRLGRRRSDLRVERRYKKPPEIEWNDDTYQGDAYGVFSYASCVVEVEVDIETGLRNHRQQDRRQTDCEE